MNIKEGIDLPVKISVMVSATHSAVHVVSLEVGNSYACA